MKKKPQLIVLDANEWISSRLLRSSTGAALLYAARKLQSQIIIPEVTLQEVIEGTVREGTESVHRIEQSYASVQVLVGQRPDYRLPVPEEFREAAHRRLSELARMLRHIPLTLDQSRSAMHRVIQHLPPSDRTEQFRDALLWEAILESAKGTCIMFASHDADFFQGHNLKNGLAKPLTQEIQAVGGTISTHADLASLVATLQQNVKPPNYDKLASAIGATIIHDLEDYARSRGFSIGEITSHTVQAFLTEQTDTLSLTFHLRFHIISPQGQDGLIFEDSEIHAYGNCFYDLASQTTRDVSLDKIEALDPSGRAIPGTSAYYLHVDSAISGTRWLPYQLRAPVDPQSLLGA